MSKRAEEAPEIDPRDEAVGEVVSTVLQFGAAFNQLPSSDDHPQLKPPEGGVWRRAIDLMGQYEIEPEEVEKGARLVISSVLSRLYSSEGLNSSQQASAEATHASRLSEAGLAIGRIIRKRILQQ